MSCPHCDSADVRPSRHTLGLDRIGLHRYRCRACGGLFWLRGADRGRARAAAEYFEALSGAAPPGPRTAALPVTLGGVGPPPATPGGLGPPPEGPPPEALSGLGPPPEALSGLDRPPDAPAPPADLRALDQELARRRSQTLPR